MWVRAVLLTGIVAAWLGVAAVAAGDGTGVVEGRVTDADGAPLADVDVSADGSAGTRTDADGRFRLVAPAGRTRIRFWPAARQRLVPEYHGGAYVEAPLTRPATVDVPDGGTVRDIDGELDEPVGYGGHVTDAAGTAQPGANIRIWVDAYDGPRSIGHSGQDADRDGDWAADDLPPVPVRIAASPMATGLARAWYPAAPRSEAAQVLRPAPGQTLTGLDFRLVPGETLVGRIVDDRGEPVDDATAFTDSDEPRGGGVGAAVTGADGRFRIGDLVPGMQTVTVIGRTTLRGAAPPVQVQAGQVADVGDVESPAGVRIRGAVRDAADDRPVNGVEVRFRRSDAPDNRWGAVGTSEEGRFDSELMPPGRYRIELLKDGHERRWVGGPTYESATVFEPERRTTREVDTVIRRGGGAISGTVDLEPGRPVGVVASIRVLTADREVVASEQVHTADGGRYALRGLPAGEHRVRLESVLGAPEFFDDQTAFADAEPVEVVAGETRGGVDARLTPRGDVVVAVQDADGAPARGVLVRFVDAETERVVAADNADAEGRARSGPLPAGSYVIGLGYRVGTDRAVRYFDDVATVDEARRVLVRDDTTTRLDRVRYAPQGDGPPPGPADEASPEPDQGTVVAPDPRVTAAPTRASRPAPSPTTGPAATAPPEPGAATGVTLRRPVVHLRDGRLRVAVDCRSGCAAHLVLTAAGRVLGRGRVAGAGTVALRPTRAGRRVARRGGRAWLTVRPPGGRAQRIAVRLRATRG